MITCVMHNGECKCGSFAQCLFSILLSRYHIGTHFCSNLYTTGVLSIPQSLPRPRAMVRSIFGILHPRLISLLVVRKVYLSIVVTAVLLVEIPQCHLVKG